MLRPALRTIAPSTLGSTSRSSPLLRPNFARALSTSSEPTASSSTNPLSSPSPSQAPLVGDVDATVDYSRRYHVPRTASGELPVYSKVRNGGGWRTIVRKVEGDVGSLQSQLNDHFAQSHIDPLREPPVVSLRPTNRHLEIRGKWVEEVKGWLESRGF